MEAEQASVAQIESTPNDDVIAPECETWCATDPTPWLEKILWSNCEGCEVCEDWCATDTTQWSLKKVWNSCKDCEVSGDCEDWCATDTTPWSLKKVWKACKGC